MRQFAVIGLGRFGSSVAKALAEKGHEVMVIDQNEDFIRDMMDVVAKAVCLDATDEKALKAVGVQGVDVAICAIGADIEASILVTLLLKELGVPVIICKAVSEQHKKVLLKIGATKVIQPEQDMGARVANALTAIDDRILEHIDLPGDASILEFVPPREFVGKTLREINVREKHGVNIIAIKRRGGAAKADEIFEGEDINLAPVADDVIEENDVLIVFGRRKDIEKLQK